MEVELGPVPYLGMDRVKVLVLIKNDLGKIIIFKRKFSRIKVIYRIHGLE